MVSKMRAIVVVVLLGLILVGLLSFVDDAVRIATVAYYTGRIDLPPEFQDMLTLTISLLIEATPFLLLGAIVSTLVRYVVPPSVWSNLAGKHVVFRRLILSFSGILLPVCECGNVPVARSLIGRGLSTGDAITFLLAAPILNPIVLFVTWQAFSYEPSIAIGRFVAALLIANIVAIAAVRILRARNIITIEFEKVCASDKLVKRTASNMAEHLKRELLPLFTLLFVGAVIAALVQVFVPREALLAIGGDPLGGIVAMILLGFVVSICSSVDAFFALAFTQSFTPGAITAFLIAGPMIDIKMVALLRSTFTLRAIGTICGLVVCLTVIAGLIINEVAL